MNKTYKIADKEGFERILENNPESPIEIEGTQNGYAIYCWNENNSNYYLLHSKQKDEVKYFKSPGTIFKYLIGLGVKNVNVTNIHLPQPESYVRHNSIRHLKPDRVKQKPGREDNKAHA